MMEKFHLYKWNGRLHSCGGFNRTRDEHNSDRPNKFDGHCYIKKSPIALEFFRCDGAFLLIIDLIANLRFVSPNKMQ